MKKRQCIWAEFCGTRLADFLPPWQYESAGTLSSNPALVMHLWPNAAARQTVAWTQVSQGPRGCPENSKLGPEGNGRVN